MIRASFHQRPLFQFCARIPTIQTNVIKGFCIFLSPHKQFPAETLQIKPQKVPFTLFQFIMYSPTTYVYCLYYSVPNNGFLFYLSHTVGQFLSAGLSHKTYPTHRQQHARTLSQTAS
jgi:hypothetical protein